MLNVAWSPLFFKLRRPDWAFFELIPFWLSILALLIELSRLSIIAGWLIAPYLAWVTFAGWLNWRIVQLNKPFPGAAGRGVLGIVEAMAAQLLEPRFIDAILGMVAIEGVDAACVARLDRPGSNACGRNRQSSRGRVSVACAARFAPRGAA